jgi:hypothetical protein
MLFGLVTTGQDKEWLMRGARGEETKAARGMVP